MFGFVQWDGAISLLLELGLSVIVVVGLLLAARSVNARSAPPPPRIKPSNPTEPVSGDTEKSTKPGGTPAPR